MSIPLEDLQHLSPAELEKRYHQNIKRLASKGITETDFFDICDLCDSYSKGEERGKTFYYVLSIMKFHHHNQYEIEQLVKETKVIADAYVASQTNL